MADSKDELFNVSMVKYKMGNIEGYFQAFAETLNQINSYIETNVNASVASSAFGDLGGKLLNIWNHNSSTFEDFHENFDIWAQVVAVITANNNQFAVEALATYRDNIGTLDGIKTAREFVYKSEGLENVSKTEGFSNLSDDAKDILNAAFGAKTLSIKKNNEYGGKTIYFTDATGKQTEVYYDDEGLLVGRRVDGTYYDAKNTKVSKLPTSSEYAKQKKELVDKYKEEDKKVRDARQKALDDAKKALDDAKKAQASDYKNPGSLSGNNLDFVNKIKDGAVKSYNEYGVLPSLTLAQAILESGWGKHSIGNNIFGIKAGKSWTGKVKKVKTSEQRSDGSYYQIYANFRDYDSIDDSIMDHAKLLSSKNYQRVIAATNYRDACKAVKACGYATSLDYANKLINIIEKYGLNQWDPKTT